MTVNMGTIDRTIRAAIGVVLLYLAFLSGVALFDETIWEYAAATVGVIMLATSAIKLCPLYSIFGIKTCKEC